MYGDTTLSAALENEDGTETARDEISFVFQPYLKLDSLESVRRDEVFDFTVRVHPPEFAAGRTFDIRLSQGELMQDLQTRENIQMYDFGYTNDGGNIVPEIWDYTFRPEDNGVRTFLTVVNTAQCVRIQVTDSEDESLTGESGEISVLPYVRKYATPSQYRDYNQYDAEFVTAADYWGEFYQHPVDPDLLKAVGIVESDLGNSSDDIMAMGGDGAVPILRGETDRPEPQ